MTGKKEGIDLIAETERLRARISDLEYQARENQVLLDTRQARVKHLEALVLEAENRGSTGCCNCSHCPWCGDNDYEVGQKHGKNCEAFAGNGALK